MSILSKVQTKQTHGMQDYTFLLYGNPKVGKTTLASKFDNMLLVDLEGGQKFVEGARVTINSWQEFRDLCQELLSTKDKHQYKTICIDTIDVLWRMCEDHVCKEANVKHVTDIPFGKGTALVKSLIIPAVQYMSRMGFGIVFISHAKEKTIKSKALEYTVMATTLGNQAEVAITGACDFILYCYLSSEGQRMMLTKPSKHVLAGDRSNKLPEKMAMNYEEIKKALMPTEETKGDKK